MDWIGWIDDGWTDGWLDVWMDGLFVLVLYIPVNNFSVTLGLLQG